MEAVEHNLISIELLCFNELYIHTYVVGHGTFPVFDAFFVTSLFCMSIYHLHSVVITITIKVVLSNECFYNFSNQMFSLNRPCTAFNSV